MGDIIKHLEENYLFYYALYVAFKTSSSIRTNKPKMARGFCEKHGEILQVLINVPNRETCGYRTPHLFVQKRGVDL